MANHLEKMKFLLYTINIITKQIKDVNIKIKDEIIKIPKENKEIII